MRVIFMGTPEFSVTALDALHAAGHEVVAVYSQPPRPAGRGKKLTPSPVHARAEALGLPVFCPANLRDSDVQAQFAALNADVAVVVAYGLLLPQEILDAPERGCMNIHASLLPRWRGAAPIHRAIMAGDEKTGICIMQMEAGLDTGPVLARAEMDIAPQDTTGALHDSLSALGAQLIVEVLDAPDALCARAQASDGVTYAEKIDKAEAQIDWTQDATAIVRQIHGLSPFPGAWTTLDGQRLKIHQAKIVDHIDGTNPGVAVNDDLTIACGTGAIQLLRLQRAGKAAQDAAAFLAGYQVPAGTVFSA